MWFLIEHRPGHESKRDHGERRTPVELWNTGRQRNAEGILLCLLLAVTLFLNADPGVRAAQGGKAEPTRISVGHRIRTGRRAEKKSAAAEDLQRLLNTFPGIFVKVDGIPGEKTSNAFKKVTGHFLFGDPRAQE